MPVLVPREYELIIELIIGKRRGGDKLATHTHTPIFITRATNMVLARRVCPSALPFSPAPMRHSYMRHTSVDCLRIHDQLTMHASFQIDILLRAIRGKLGSKHNGPHVRHIHRFLINACHMPKDKLEHPGFLGSTANWNALAWDSRAAAFSTIASFGIAHWLVCPTPHTMTP